MTRLKDHERSRHYFEFEAEIDNEGGEVLWLRLSNEFRDELSKRGIVAESYRNDQYSERKCKVGIYLYPVEGEEL